MLPAFPGMKVAHDRMARLRSSCAAKESTRHHAMQLARSSNATGERCRKARMHFALAPSPFFGAFRHTPFIRLMASSAERRMQRPPILVTQYPSACTSQPEPTAIRRKRMWGASARMRNISCSGGGDNEAVKSRDGRPRRLGPGISCGRETESTLTACGQKGKGKGKGKKKNERAHSIVLSKLVRAPHVATAYTTARTESWQTRILVSTGVKTTYHERWKDARKHSAVAFTLESKNSNCWKEFYDSSKILQKQLRP